MNLNDHSSIALAPYRLALNMLGIPEPEHTPSDTDPSKFTAMPAKVTAAAIDAIDAGRDPLDDPAVLRAVVAERLGAGRFYEAMKAREDAAYIQKFKDAAPSLRAQVIEKFDAAVQDMKNAAATLGYFDLRTPLTIAAGMTPEDAATTATTMRAHATVELIREQWGNLIVMDSNMPHPNDYMRPLLWMDLSATELDEWHHQRNVIITDTNTPEHKMGQVTSWDAVHAGYTLSLAKDAAAFQARVKRVEDEKAEELERRRREAQARGSIVL